MKRMWIKYENEWNHEKPADRRMKALEILYIAPQTYKP